MRVLRSIVQPFVLPVLHAREDLTFRCSIAPQRIGNNHARDVLEPFEELAEKSLRSFAGCVGSEREYPAQCRPDPLPAKGSAFDLES